MAGKTGLPASVRLNDGGRKKAYGCKQMFICVKKRGGTGRNGGLISAEQKIFRKRMIRFSPHKKGKISSFSRKNRLFPEKTCAGKASFPFFWAVPACRIRRARRQDKGRMDDKESIAGGRLGAAGFHRVSEKAGAACILSFGRSAWLDYFASLPATVRNGRFSRCPGLPFWHTSSPPAGAWGRMWQPGRIGRPLSYKCS